MLVGRRVQSDHSRLQRDPRGLDRSTASGAKPKRNSPKDTLSFSNPMSMSRRALAWPSKLALRGPTLILVIRASSRSIRISQPIAEYPFSMPFGMDSFDIYEAMYDREFKFVSRHEHRVALFEADPAASPFIEAVFGGFPVDGPLQPLSRAYVEAFDPVKLVPNAENWIKIIKEGFRVPLSFTMESLKRDHSDWTEPTLFVVDPASALDLIDLWNIRQFHPQILPVNLSWFQDAKEFLTEFVQTNYRPLPGNPNGVMIRTTIQFGRSIVSGDHQKAVERGKAILSEAGHHQTGGRALVNEALVRPNLDGRPRRLCSSAATGRGYSGVNRFGTQYRGRRP